MQNFRSAQSHSGPLLRKFSTCSASLTNHLAVSSTFSLICCSARSAPVTDLPLKNELISCRRCMDLLFDIIPDRYLKVTEFRAALLRNLPAIRETICNWMCVESHTRSLRTHIWENPAAWTVHLQISPQWDPCRIKRLQWVIVSTAITYRKWHFFNTEDRRYMCWYQLLRSQSQAIDRPRGLPATDLTQ